MASVVGPAATKAEVEREIRRICDRLGTIRLDRLDSVAHDCRGTARLLVEHTRRCDPTIPSDAQVPALATNGLAAMIALLGRDYLDVADRDPDIAIVLDHLVRLRRALP